MFTILRTFVHMLQIAAMVSVGFALFFSLLEGGRTKKLANLFRRTLARPQQKAAARSRL